MKHKMLSLAVTVLLTGCFLACGLLIPSAYVHWQQRQLTGTGLSIQKADVSPYGENTPDWDRIGALLQAWDLESAPMVSVL